MKSEQPQQHDNPCYTDYALQEYVLGRHSEELIQAISAHSSHCSACETMIVELRLEQQYLLHIRTYADTTTNEHCHDELVLAQFMDGALSDEDQNGVVNHLSSCDSCRRKLILLYRDVREALSALQESKSTVNKGAKPDLILLDSKREILPDTQKLPQFPMRGTGTDVR